MADMDAVNSFNAELQSLYDVKPPISKGKMTAVTRAALKGVKLYKHVVQSVEKFIQKCKSEYKIPGLYVIDSIIRQSRHQFGADKDVFAPRFSRNIQTTFMHLYKCPEEDKAKIIRVLNLWQKNKIFTPEVIQPLFDLADPNNPIWEQLQQQQEQTAKSSGASGGGGGQSSGSGGMSSILSNLPSVPFKKDLLDYDYGDDEEGGDSSKNNNSNNNSGGDYGQNQNSNNVGLDALGSILANPEILRQLATLQEQIAAATGGPSSGNYHSSMEQERQRKLAELNKQEAAFDQRLAQTVARLPFAVECELPSGDDRGGSRKDGSSVDQNSNQLAHQHQTNQLLPPPFFQQISGQHNQEHSSQQQAQQQQQQNILNLLSQHQDGQNPFNLPLNFPSQGGGFPHQQDLAQAMSMFNSQITGNDGMNQNYGGFNQNQPGPVEIDLTDDTKEKDRRDRRRKRSRDRRSRSNSRTRAKRSRSRSRGRKRYRSRDRKEEKEREREREKERTRKGLPTIKKEYLSVCSTTLWVGHLSKLVSQEELSDTFGALGDIVSIDLIPPRGCAFIVMNRRQDALRALDRLKNTKLQGKTITMAWAPGKGVKGREWKDFWEVEAGVSYIPWAKLRSETNVEEFEDGGCIDEDTLPDFLKNKPKASELDKGSIPLPESAEDSQDGGSIAAASIPTPSSASQMSSLLASASAMLGGMGNSSDNKQDSGAMAAMNAAAGQQGPPGIPGMPNAFGIPPPIGMMPLGLPVGMVPPPMMGPGGMPGFPGMAGLPGMPMMGNMGMMGPGLGVGPGGPMGGPGLLGDMPPSNMPNLSQLNNMQLNSGGLNMDKMERPHEDDDKRRQHEGRREGKRRSRFDDPEDRHSTTMEDVGHNSPPGNMEIVKDDRPVFERLKSLAEGYSFSGGMNNDKPGSLLGTPLMGSRGPGDRMPGPPRGFPPPLIPHGPNSGPNNNQFSPRGPQFMGDRSRAPGPPGMGGSGGPRPPWFDNSNPFLNPNPFAGNPFVQGNMSENPFDIGGGREGDNSGPTPLFGGPPPGPGGDRGGFGGRGGGRGGWSRDGPPGGGRGGRGGGRGGWRDRENTSQDRDNRDRGGGFRGGRGGGRDSDRGRDDRDRRDRSRGSRERDSGGRDRRDRRDRSREDGNGYRDRRGRRSSPEEKRDRRSSERPSSHSNDRRPPPAPVEQVDLLEENWEDDGVPIPRPEPGVVILPPHGTQANVFSEECWEDEAAPQFSAPARKLSSENNRRPSQNEDWDWEGGSSNEIERNPTHEEREIENDAEENERTQPQSSSLNQQFQPVEENARSEFEQQDEPLVQHVESQPIIHHQQREENTESIYESPPSNQYSQRDENDSQSNFDNAPQRDERDPNNDYEQDTSSGQFDYTNRRENDVGGGNSIPEETSNSLPYPDQPHPPFNHDSYEKHSNENTQVHENHNQHHYDQHQQNNDESFSDQNSSSNFVPDRNDEESSSQNMYNNGEEENNGRANSNFNNFTPDNENRMQMQVDEDSRNNMSDTYVSEPVIDTYSSKHLMPSNPEGSDVLRTNSSEGGEPNHPNNDSCSDVRLNEDGLADSGETNSNNGPI